MLVIRNFGLIWRGTDVFEYMFVIIIIDRYDEHYMSDSTTRKPTIPTQIRLFIISIDVGV